MEHEPKNAVVKLSEHLSVAQEMAESIVEKCNPDQQNEMVRHIRQIVSEQRQLKMEEAEKHLTYLKETFENL